MRAYRGGDPIVTAQARREQDDRSRPLAAMKNCHVRILTRCAAPAALLARLRECDPDEQARRAATRFRDCFDPTARRQREDKEANRYPLSETRLSGGALAEIGAGMARHRGGP